jgi:hypothetical protein
MMTGTSDDPSSAWRTDAGEWRFVGQSVATAGGGGMPLYSAGRNFSSIHMIGLVKHEQGGDCMSLFPLPPTPLGRRPAETDLSRDGSVKVQPTHVMMQSAQTKLGVWADAPVGELSTWTNSFDIPEASPETCGGCNTPGCTASFQCGFERLDLGARYADKDFADPVKDRRLLWGWAVVDEGSQGLLRELQYDARLGPHGLIKAPVEELSQLRQQPALVSSTDQEIAVGGHLWLGDQLLPEKRGNQSEILISFKRPETAVVLGIDVMAGADGGGGRNRSQRVYIAYVPNASSVRVGVGSPLTNQTSRMDQTMLTVSGHNRPDPPSVPVHSADECAERCKSDGDCAAWTVDETSAPYGCGLLGAAGWDARQDPTAANFTSGVARVTPGASPGRVCH